MARALSLDRPEALGPALGRPEWLHPAVTILLGAHELPFAFLYGMRMSVALSGVLVGGGFWLGVTANAERPAFGGWGTGVVLVLFAVLGRASAGSRWTGSRGRDDFGRTARRS